MDEDGDLRPFFGSWFDLQGYKQTGYFLGYQLIKMLCQRASLHEIAVIDDVVAEIRPLLAQLAT